MRPWSTLALVAACLTLTGCGVVFTPIMQQLPGPVQAIRVVDDQTNRSVGDAHLSYEVLRHGGTTHQPPALRDCPTKDVDPNAPVVGELTVERRRDGAFLVEKDQRFAMRLWYFPFRRDGSYHYYRDFAVRIRAAGADHEPLTLEYAVARPPVMGWTETGGGGRVMLDAAGVLWFRLRSRPATTGPN